MLFALHKVPENMSDILSSVCYQAKPDAQVPIEVTAESFIGSSVGDAAVTLSWKIYGRMEFLPASD